MIDVKVLLEKNPYTLKWSLLKGWELLYDKEHFYSLGRCGKNLAMNIGMLLNFAYNDGMIKGVARINSLNTENLEELPEAKD